MKNILIELAEESSLPITAQARVRLFDELKERLVLEGSVRVGLLQATAAMDPKDLVGAKSQMIRMARLGILNIDTAFLDASGQVLKTASGAVRMAELTEAQRSEVATLDFIISMTEATIKTMIERSGQTADVVVANPYEEQPTAAPRMETAASTDDAAPADPAPSLGALGGEVPRSDFAAAAQTMRTVDDGRATGRESPPQKTIILKAKTHAMSKKIAVYAVGFVATAGVGLVMFLKTKDLDQKYTSIEQQIQQPAEGLRVVKLSEMERLYETIETLKAESVSLRRDGELKISKELARITEEMNQRRAAIEQTAYQRGREDAVGLSVSLRERFAMIAKRHVVLTGGCEATGRGNRIDRINLDGYGANVKYWLVDPTNISIAGVVASNEKLMNMKDGAVVEVRCVGGEAKMIPSIDEPAMGSDGKHHPSDEEGAGDAQAAAPRAQKSPERTASSQDEESKPAGGG